MAQSIENSLLEAIKKDDIKAFGALMERAQCGAYRLGRFPVLSLMYLYKSRKLISAYEEKFLSIASYNELGEPMEISAKFSAKAGKCLRRYLNEIVSPLEMLLILDNTRRLKRVYPLAKNVTAAVKWRLNSIYYIKYSLSVKFEGNDIIIEKRPLSYGEKKRIATICISALLALIIVIGLPVTTVSLMPKPVEGEVTKLSQIDFASDKAYTLKKDIIIPENYSVKDVNCEIIGDGHTLKFSSGARFENFNGKISGFTVESTGEPIINTVAQNAVVEDLTVNINANITAAESTALFVLSNYGVIRNVSVNVSGKLKVEASEDTSSGLTFGAIAWSNEYNVYDSVTDTFNDGLIEGCVVNYSQFALEGELTADAAFGGVVAVNNGCLNKCAVTGEIVGDTVDIAGVCYANNVLIRECVNRANIIQTSNNSGWSPIVCGIVRSNNNTVEKSVNEGSLSATSNVAQTDVEEGSEPTATVAGIAYANGGIIDACANDGTLKATAIGAVYAAGISARTISQISNCISSGDIIATAKTIYAGGISAVSEVTSQWGYVYFGSADNCISECKITATASGDEPNYVGGILGCVTETGFNGFGGVVYYGGCVRNSFFIGTIESDLDYQGAIVGVSGANIYGTNSFSSSSGAEFNNFVGNYYLNSYEKAFGATVTAENVYENEIEDKGAQAATIEEIRALEAYKEILKLFN